MSDNRVRYLDGWRGWAILLVLFGHYFTSKGINLGRFGVELFFVLSGRLMAEILFVRNTPLSNFFPRRFSRVYPGLAVLALIVLGAALIFRHPDLKLAQFASVLTFTYNYVDTWVGHSAVLDQTWSLCVEEHMYILLGLLALLHKARPLPIAYVCASGALAAVVNGMIQTALGGNYYSVYWRTDVRGASILIGATLYLLLRDRKAPSAWLPSVLAAIGLLLNVNAVPDALKYSLGTGCLAAALVLFGRTTGAVMRVLEHPVLLRVGLWSYSIYLWQEPFYKVAGSFIHRLMILPVAIGVALISFYLVEQPARVYLNAAWRTRCDVVSEQGGT